MKRSHRIAVGVVLFVGFAVWAQRRYEADPTPHNIRIVGRSEAPAGPWDVNCCADAKSTDAGVFPLPGDGCVTVKCADLFTAACRTACVTAWRAKYTD